MKTTEETNQKIACGVIGLLIGMLLIFFIFLPHYTRIVTLSHYAEQVIEECIDQYPDFYDTIAEGDSWSGYVDAQKALYNDKY